VNCITEAEHALLSGWAENTIEAKRKRGEGPPYIRHGNNYFYPRPEYREYLRARVRERKVPTGKDAL
jgi:hypothetical protein